jgi:RecG-like helicase
MSLTELQFLTEREKIILEKIGFESLYDVITFLPNKLEVIEPMEIGFFEPKKADYYIFNGVLRQVNLKKKNKVFFELIFDSQIGEIKLLWFGTVKLSQVMFEIGQKYQVLSSFQKNFYKLNRISVLKEKINDNYFVLGKSEIKTRFITRYPTLKNNSNGFFKIIFNKIPRNLFILDLQNLVPNNKIIKSPMDLYNLHFPEDHNQYINSFHQFVAFKLFLKLSLRSYYNFESTQNISIKSELNKDFLTDLSQQLPFDLNITQKNAIWSIIKDFSGN